MTARRSREQDLGSEVGMNETRRVFVVDQSQQLFAETKSRHDALTVAGDENEPRVEKTVHHSTAVDFHRESAGDCERDLLGD